MSRPAARQYVSKDGFIVRRANLLGSSRLAGQAVLYAALTAPPGQQQPQDIDLSSGMGDLHHGFTE
jgi:hypothetical protein